MAVCLILCSMTGLGGEGVSRSGLSSAAKDPVLEGIFNLPDLEECLVNDSRSSPFCYALPKGARVGNLEVVAIDPVEGRVELAIHPGMRSLVLKTTNSLPVGISFQNAGLPSVLRLYGEWKGRNILHPFLGSRTLTMSAPVKTKAEAAKAIEGALKQEGLAFVPDGMKFMLVMLKAQAASTIPRSSLLKGSSQKTEQPQAVLPSGAVDFRNADILQAAPVYADLAGRQLEDADQARRLGGGVISFLSQTPLTKEEVRYAFDILFAWEGFQMVEVGEKGVKLVRKVRPQR